MRARARGEDVEDQLAAVEDLDLELLLEVAHLGGRQVVVEDDHVGVGGLDELLELLDLALADVGREIDVLALLEHAADHDQAGRLGQAAESRPGGRRASRRVRGRITPTRIARSRRPERSVRLVSIKAGYDLTCEDFREGEGDRTRLHTQGILCRPPPPVNDQLTVQTIRLSRLSIITNSTQRRRQRFAP